MIRMNESDVPIAHRKRLDDKTFVDEPISGYLCNYSRTP